LGLLLAAAVPAAAGQLFVPSGKDTLRALPGVEVIVESVPDELDRAGVTPASIRAGVVRGLEAGGIRVYTSQAENPSPAKAYLDVRITLVVLPRRAGYVAAVQMHLRQTLASVVTESKVVNAGSWDAGVLVNLTVSDLPKLRTELQGLVEEFVKDWRAVH
jgi:hypothetical protein